MKMLVQNWTCLRRFALSFLLACSAAHGKNEMETAGLAVYTETARDIYIAGLLMPAKAGLENVFLAPGPKGMEYRIATRRISSRGFSGTLLLQAEFGSGERAPDQVIDVLNDLKKNIKGSLLRGDSFVIFLSEDEKTTFYLNDTKLLSVDDGAVFDFFFAGWVGESSSALFRDRLLSGNLNADTLSRFERLRPAEKRVAVISDWMAPPEPEPESEPVAAEAAIPTAQEKPAQVAEVSAEKTAAPNTGEVVVPGPAPATTVAAAMPAPAVVSAEQPSTAAEQPAATAEKQSAAADESKQVAMVTASKTADEAPALDDREYQQQLSVYVSDIMRKVFGKVKYPKRAIKRDREGKVELLVYVDAEGTLLDLALDNSSGYDSLDQAATKAIRSAAPFPELTQAAREEFISEDGSNYVMPIPITFRLQR
jgi:protein TonB